MWKLLLFCAIAQVAHSACPAGFDLVGNECRGSYAKVMASPSNVNVVTAATIAMCNGILGKPVIIHNDEEQFYWTHRAYDEPSSYGDPLLVLALSCNSTSKQYSWADGSPLDFKPLEYDSRGGNAFTVDVGCTTELKQPTSPGGATCGGFDIESDDGACYQVGASAENWQDSQTICKKFGADLASIHNAQLPLGHVALGMKSTDPYSIHEYPLTVCGAWYNWNPNSCFP